MLFSEVAPIGLHLPQFTYAEPKVAPNTDITGNDPPTQYEESLSHGFPFSAFFQPSSSVSPGLSIFRPSPGLAPACGSASNSVPRSSLSDSTSSASSFIGFSWGPLPDAFPHTAPTSSADLEHGIESRNTHLTLIPGPIHGTPASGPYHNLLVPTSGPAGRGGILSTPRPFTNNIPYNYSTPLRPYAFSPHHTLQRTSTIRRSSAPRRTVSDREAMKQLVDCVGMSARKKVLESGRKPRVVGIWSLGGKSGIKAEGTGRSWYKKELRFDPLATPIPRPDYSALGPSSETGTARSHQNNPHNSNDDDQRNNQPRAFAYDYPSSEGTNTDSEDGVGGPPSPSPSPRPGSAMSMISMSRRSATPTTATMLTMSGSVHNLTTTGTLPATSHRNNSVTQGAGYSSIPSATSRASNLGFKIGNPPKTTVAVAIDGSAESRTAGIPSTRTRSNIQSLKHSESFAQFVSRNGSRRIPTQNHDDDDEQLGHNAPRLTEPQSQSHSQWDELESRLATMMVDIEDLEERFHGLNASLTNGYGS